MASTIFRPDATLSWHFERTLNRHYESVLAASTRWVESFHALDPKGRRKFNRCKFALFVSIAYPDVGPDHLRLTCDLMNWFFVFDEISDVKDGAQVRKLAAILLDVLRDPLPPLPSDSPVLGDMTKCLWTRICAFSTPSSAQRLSRSLEQYIHAVCSEAEDGDQGVIRNIEDYLVLRRGRAGPKPCFDMFLLTHDIPDEVMLHPRIQKLTDGGMDLIALGNVMYSYIFERSHDLDGNNILAAVMKEKSLDIQSAIDYTSGIFHRTAQDFLTNLKKVPSFSTAIDHAVLEYLFGLGTWVTALHEWLFESERDFEINGLQTKQSRRIVSAQNPSEQRSGNRPHIQLEKSNYTPQVLLESRQRSQSL